MSIEFSSYMLYVEPNEWFKPFNHYSEIPYEITDEDEEWVKPFPVLIRDLGEVRIETTRINEGKRGQAIGYDILYFNGKEELVIPWNDRTRQEELAGNLICQLTRWHPKFLASPEGNYVLCVRLPSLRVVEQVNSWWVDRQTGERFWEVMANESEDTLNQLELAYCLPQTIQIREST